MSVRNSAKAIVLHNGKILLNRCTSRFGEYYALPGGGQNDGETLCETVRRELLEETGYEVKPMRMSGIYERISDRQGQEGVSIAHKIYFIFLCSLASETPKVPTEHDKYQIGLEWVDVNDICYKNLFPQAIRENIKNMLGSGETIFLGSEKEKL